MEVIFLNTYNYFNLDLENRMGFDNVFFYQKQLNALKNILDTLDSLNKLSDLERYELITIIFIIKLVNYRFF